MKIHAKGFLVLVSLMALTFTPALFADGSTAEPNLFEKVWQMVVEVVMPRMGEEEKVESPMETEAGPHVIFVG